MTSRTPTIEPIAENIYGIVTDCGDDVDVRALLLCGQRFSLLIDTLLRPSDLDGVRELVAAHGRPLLLVNSHADWDHWWGNGAFPDAPIFAHRLTQERQRKEGKRSLVTQQKAHPDDFTDVMLLPATIAFDGRLDLDLGGMHVELTLLPGHTSDCVVAYVPERLLLFAADAAEDPIPLLNEPVHPGDWAERLDIWADRARMVIPAHGPVSDPELLHRNAAYLHGLISDREAVIPELKDALPFYGRAHRRNLKRVLVP